MSFAKQVGKFSVKAINAAEQDRRAICFKLFSAIIQDTPVGNPDLWKSGKAPAGYVGGRLRGNWQTSVGAPATGSLDVIDPQGVQALQDMQSNLGNGTTNDVTIYFVNNLPYASRIEFEGHSSQAPRGMVRRNVARFNRLVAQAVREGKL